MKLVFTPLAEIAEAVAARIRAACPALQSVTVASATNAAQLWQVIDALIVAPAAVVCVGQAECKSEESDLSRSVQIVIALSDEFRASTQDQALGIWSLAETVAAQFYPTLDGADDAEIEWTEDNLTPGVGSDRTSVIYLNLNCKEYAQYEAEG